MSIHVAYKSTEWRYRDASCLFTWSTRDWFIFTWLRRTSRTETWYTKHIKHSQTSSGFSLFLLIVTHESAICFQWRLEKKQSKRNQNKAGRLATKILFGIRKKAAKIVQIIFSLVQIQADLQTCPLFRFFLRRKVLHYTASKSSTLSQMQFSAFYVWTLFLFVHFPWLSLCFCCKTCCVPPHLVGDNLPHSTPARYTFGTSHSPLCRTNRNTRNSLVKWNERQSCYIKPCL